MVSILSACYLDPIQEVTLDLARGYLTNTMIPSMQCIHNLFFLTFYMPHLKVKLTEEG